MKQILKLSLLLLALLLPATASAYFEVDGIYYNINGTGATVTYRGTSYSQYDEYSGSVTIPETVTYNGTTYSVTAIGDRAFMGCSGLTSVTIPNSVTTIGNEAFHYCSGLTSIYIPNSVTAIGDWAFNECTGLTSATIGNSVTTIGKWVFYNCSGLTSINIPNSITTISECAFYGCSGLTSVTIPNSVTTIGDNAFMGCSGLTNATIGNSVTTIGNSAFSGCTGLTSVTIGNSVTAIGEGAFYECSGLTSIDIPNSVTTIGSEAFYKCSGLTDLIWNARNCSSNGKMTTSSIERVTIGKEVEVLPSKFVSGSKITSIDIPNSVTTIGGDAFYGCSGLTSVTIPNSVTTIGDYAFMGCSGLTSIDIPNSVTTIGISAFNECTGLTSATIGNSVTTIGVRAFFYCSGLTSIDIPNSVTTIGIEAFRGCSGLTSVNIGNSVTTIGDNAFMGCSGLTSIDIPKSVTTIGEAAFYGCTGLHTVLFNAVNCTSIGYHAFSYYSIKAVININVSFLQFGDSVQHIPAELPSLNMYGKVLIIPNSVKTIDAGAIKGNCAAVVIGKGIEDIAAGAFSSGIRVAYATTAEPVPCQPTAFANPQTLYVPAGSKMKYFTAPGWSEFTNIIEEEYIPATAVELDKDNVTLYRFASLQLSATVFPDSASTSSVYWYSLNSDVASVSDNGMVYANSVGETDIIVWADQVSDTCHVIVTPIMVENISFNVNHLSMALDETFTLTATVTPYNAENTTLEWEIPDNEVLLTQLVNNNKLNIGAAGEGTVTITVRATDGSGVSASCVVTVAQVIVLATSVKLDCESAQLTEGETLRLTATVLPGNTTDKTVTWVSSDEAVATVDGTGLVTAIAAGTASITATTVDGSNLSASCKVTVVEDLSNYDNYLSIDNIEAFHGDTIVIPVKMTNAVSIISFQTDIFLPEGLELLKEDGEYIIDPSERMTRTHSIMSNDVSNGAVRVICYSSNYKPFTGNSGDDLFYITVKVADDAEGDYTVLLGNTLLTTSSFEEIAAPDVAANIHIKAYLLGDANNSGTVTITDVVVTSQYVLEMNPQPFVFEAADVNFDGNITVTDVSRIVWMVLNPDEAKAPLRAPALWNNGDRMSGEGVSLMAGETRTVSITLDNEMDYTAFQMDLTLPEGLTASNFRLTDRAGSHAFDINTIANGKTRALCYSPAIEVIDGHDGALLTFDVTANAAIEGCITIDGIELVTADCQTVHPDAFTIGVNAATSINEIAGSKTVARVDYFNVAGQRIDQPKSGVTLVVTTYTDGTRTTAKVIR